MTPTTSFSLAHLSRPPTRAGEGKPPGLLLLHGVGSNERDLMGLAPYVDPRFHVISARGPIEMGPQMFGWFWIDVLPDGNFRYSEEEARASLRQVSTLIEQVVEAYGLDPARLFLGGFSQGAIQSCALLLTEPEKVAGVVAMSGRWPAPAEAERAPDERLAGKPVLAVHGLYDPIIPIRYGRALRDKFQALPVALTYQEFPMPHTVSEQSLALATGWLTEQLDHSEQG